MQSTRLEDSPNYKWILAVVLFFVSAINYADRTSITAVYSLLKTDFGFDDVGIGALGSLFLWSYALMSPFAGHVGDRAHRGRVVLWSLAGWSLITVLTGLVATRAQLLGMRTLLGVVEAFYLPAGMALLIEYHGQRTRGTALGIMGLGNYAGLVGGGTIGGYLGQHYGWRSPLLVLGVAGLVLAVGCWFTLPAGRLNVPKRSEERVSPLAMFRIPSFLVIATAAVLTSIGTWIFINWLPLYFRETFQMNLATAGFFGASLVSVSAAFSQAAGGVVSDRIARHGAHHRMLMHAILIACSAPVLLTFVFTHDRNLIMYALVLYSVLRAAGDCNVTPVLCDLVRPDQRSLAVGFTNMLNTIVGGLGIFVAGFLKAGFGLAGIFAGIAGILALDAILLFAGYFFLLKRDLQKAGTL